MDRRLSRDERLAGRVVFLEDYDMGSRRCSSQGCDVWLNTPRRPQEASGTSGMKAAMNGVLNLSVLDGWWPEVYEPDDRLGYRRHATTRPTRPSYTGCSRRRSSPRTPIGALGRDDEGVDRAPDAALRDDRAVREYVEGYYLPAHRSARS